MKLYYSPGACSLSPHIALLEAGLACDLVKVDLRAKKLENGDDYLKVNPKGQVPALALDSGEIVTEGPVIIQMIADKVAAKNLAPARDSAERYKLLEWLNFITTELHKNFAPMFSDEAGEDTKRFHRDMIARRLEYVEGRMGPGPFLMGDTLTIADPYMFVMTRWADRLIGLDAWPKLAGFYAMMLQRPSVRNVLGFEGLLQKEAAG